MNCITCQNQFKPRLGARPQRYCSIECRRTAESDRRRQARSNSAGSDGLREPSNSAGPPGATGDARLGRRVRLWVDDPLIGSGERPFVITAIGPGRVRLFSCAALVEIEVFTRIFEAHAEFV